MWCVMSVQLHSRFSTNGSSSSDILVEYGGLVVVIVSLNGYSCWLSSGPCFSSARVSSSFWRHSSIPAYPLKYGSS